MTPDVINQVATGLLLSTWALVLGIAIVFAVLAARAGARNRKCLASLPENLEENSFVSFRQPQSSAFDGPCRWLAIQCRSMEAGLSALELDDATPCSWNDGVTRFAEHHLFVSPPIRGWILVVGKGLPDPSDEIDHCFHVVRNMSDRLGSVQFFSSNPAVDHHAWVQAEDGKILRAYARAEETLWNQGKITRAERDIGMKCFDYFDHPPPQTFETGKTSLSNAEKLHSLAGRWSIDPT
ncbi:MAG: hypothetical protein O2960_13200, partial [Verrucomicrobia bacterium]|nr:hypothetical protein [Verrucomicrobiota bacterium]